MRKLTRPRAVLARLTDEIIERKGRIGRDLYAIGQRLMRIRDEALWRAGGYPSFDAYLREGAGIPKRTAYRFMRVAQHFSAAIAKRYGVIKLEAAVSYLERTRADEQPGDLLATDIRIRDRHGRWTSRPLHQATAEQIRAATRLLEASRGPRHRVPAAMRRRAEALGAKMPRAPKGTGGGPRVRLSRGDDGRLAVTFVAVPLDELGAFLELAEQDLLD